jgi:hypothetical protein
VQPSPTTALIALLASAAGSLTAWYWPSLIPGLILGTAVYAGAILLGTKAFGLDRNETLLGTSRVLLLALALTLTAVLRACITGINALARWDTSQLTRTGATQP